MLDCKEYSIILVGSAALPATIEILEDKGEELRKRYSKRYLDEAYARLIEYRKIQEASAKAFFVGNALGVSSMCSLDDDKIQSEP